MFYVYKVHLVIALPVGWVFLQTIFSIVAFKVEGLLTVSLVCLFVYSTVRSTAFTTKDIVVSGSDDRTVKVSSLQVRGQKC